MFDIKSAMRWIAENADSYMLDTSRTALCGASAGSYLAMMAAFTQDQPGFDNAPGEPSCSVLAVVNQFGPIDFTKIHTHYDESGFARAQSPEAKSTLELLLGIDPHLIPNLLRFANPIDNVHPSVPPVLIQHGKYDPIIPYQQAVALYEKLKTLGVEVELDLSEAFLHADPGYAGEESVERIFGFLDKYLK
jgi:acetyl esterase/lipase